MSRDSIRLMDLYVYRQMEKEEIQFMLLKRSSGKIYAGQWRMIGGKVLPDETTWQAALRELSEETGLSPKQFWGVPTINHFYDSSRDRIHLIPAFAAEIAPDSVPVLDDEHEEYQWVNADEIDEYLVWPEQIRIFHTIRRILINDQLIDDWIIRTDTT
ncbi:MAG: NUDIX domain-containing protein [Balneolaceae bacterium]